MSLYVSDPRVHPASVAAYRKRRRPVTVLPPMRSARPPEPAYADFFEVGRAATIAAG